MKGILMTVLAVLPALPIHATNERAENDEAEMAAFLEAAMKPPCVFGYCMGQTINDEAEGDVKGVSYRIYDHRAFNGGIAVSWTNNTGVCRVAGFHHVVAPDDYGRAHKSAVARYAAWVAQKYGEPENTVDVISASSKWADEPRHWLMGLRKGERHLAHYWTDGLPNGVTAIEVRASAASVVVLFEFDNAAECVDVGQQSLGDGF